MRLVNAYDENQSPIQILIYEKGELEPEYRAMHAAEADRRAEREYRDLLERWDREEAALKAGKQFW